MSLLTLEQIYTAPIDWIKRWLAHGEILSSGDELLDRYNVITLVYNENQLAVADEYYVLNPEFVDLFLAPDKELRAYFSGQDVTNLNRLDLVRKIIDTQTTTHMSSPVIEEKVEPELEIPVGCQTIINLHTNIIGGRIFDVFAKKQAANQIYNRERDRVDFFFRTKQLTSEDRDNLLKDIDYFEKLNREFVDRVRKDKSFYEKSGAGKPLRKIETPEDWAEAIVELENNTTTFKDAIQATLQKLTNPSHLKDFCEKADQCPYPCTKEKLFLRGEKCSYIYSSN